MRLIMDKPRSADARHQAFAQVRLINKRAYLLSEINFELSMR
jgi:hypothetical protein